jgi:hypothetical protein
MTDPDLIVSLSAQRYPIVNALVQTADWEDTMSLSRRSSQ